MFCLTKLFVVISCDGSNVLDGILEIQNIIVLCFYVSEGTDVVVNSIAKDVLYSENELTGALSDKIESWDWLCLLILPLYFPIKVSKTDNIKW